MLRSQPRKPVQRKWDTKMLLHSAVRTYLTVRYCNNSHFPV